MSTAEKGVGHGRENAGRERRTTRGVGIRTDIDAVTKTLAGLPIRPIELSKFLWSTEM
jgi:hypothetical protein